MAISSAHVLDVNQRDFQSSVVQRSHELPVVVDFWAPWCGPCRTLGPILERQAVAANGTFVLAKVNVDQNQQLAMQFGVQGIPAVKAFRNGAVVSEFTGALPEKEVRAWLAKLVPSPLEQLVAEAQQLERTDPAGAVALYQRVLQSDPQHGPSRLGLGRTLLLMGDPQAETVLDEIKIGTPEYAVAQALLELTPLLAANDTNSDGSGSVAERWQQAANAVRQQQWSDALQHLLAIVQRDRAFGDDAARRAMLAIFALLGEHDLLVAQYRRQLASAVFG